MASSTSELERIQELIPHRAPFLFLSRIVEDGEDWIAAEWDVPDDLFAFEGHFPGEPVLPGVLISESCFQAGACLIYSRSAEDRQASGVPVLARIEDARFKQIVRPGDRLRLELRLEERLANARYMKAQVSCEGRRVARLKFVLAVAEQPS